MENVR
jgi:hypothetical protein